MGNVWTTFTAARLAYDTSYAQIRKSAQTEDITNLDTARDQILSGYLNA